MECFRRIKVKGQTNNSYFDYNHLVKKLGHTLLFGDVEIKPKIFIRCIILKHARLEIALCSQEVLENIFFKELNNSKSNPSKTKKKYSRLK